jgi:hypothetical protein
MALCAPPAQAAGAVAGELEQPATPGPLSDEQTVTRWSTALDPAVVRSRPDAGADPVARLRYQTESGLPEIYVGLEQALGADGRRWVRVRVPGRPNGRTGWVRRTALGRWRVSRDHFRIDQRSLVASLRRRGRVIWRARIGVGTRATPTPHGAFYVRERLRNLAGSPIYGPVAFGTSAYSRLSEWPGGGVIGIHGTNRPDLLPGRVSHGCVRVSNREVRRLARLLRVGTPVLITRPSS